MLGPSNNQAPLSRRLMMPPNLPRRHAGTHVMPRIYPNYHQGMNNTYSHLSPMSPPPHQGHGHLPQHHLYQPRPWYHGRMYPPQSLMQPPLLHPENQWICDFCNVASFTTYEEACAHEESCKCRRGNQEGDRMNIDSSSSSKTTITTTTDGAANDFHKGTISLAIQDTDREWLSELNCFVRNYCVEAFSATADDVSRSSKRGRIALNQVGIRCRYCAHCPMKEKAVGAVSFPTSVDGIYESVKRWQRVHLELCDSVPQDVRTKLATLANTNVWVPTTRQYWSDSAKALGLVDTNTGIRFGKSLGESATTTTKPVSTRNGVLAGKAQPTAASSMERRNELDMIGNTEGQGYVVYPTDMEMIPSYVYFLMRQVEPCHFTEADRFVARSKGPVGYPGFQCRHCNGHAGLGKYFPVTSKSLSTNSTSQNIHAHLLKCRKCPEVVKDELVQLKIEKSRAPRLEPGWRKIFFDKIWERLHGEEGKEIRN